MSEHTKNGNCFTDEVVFGCKICGDDLCDVCHMHDDERLDQITRSLESMAKRKTK